MKYWLLGCTAMLVVGCAGAAPFDRGDPKTGKALFDKAGCDTCHASLMGGDGSRLFTRPDRKIKSADALLKRVNSCAGQVGAQWFSDEEEHVASYLNRRYYKFK